MSWKRPEHIPFPNVWSRFEGRILVQGKPLKYRIQDITGDLIEPVIEHMVRYFMVRELCKAHDGFSEDEVSIKELTEIWREKLRQRMGLVVIVEGEGDEKKRIAGCNLLSVVQKTDTKPDLEQFKGRCMRRKAQRHKFLSELVNIFEEYRVDRYLTALGLNVAPQYEGDNIGYHLLVARTPLCQACGITLTVTAFSHPAINHVAVKAGFEIYRQIDRRNHYIDGEIHFPRELDGFNIFAVKVIPVLQENE